MREKNRKPIASYIKLPQFTTMNVIDGQAGVIIYSSLICYSLTIDNILNIIVLLILAGVTIVTLTGDNGLLQKANEAKNTTIEAEGLERIKLAVMASHDKNGIDTTSLAKNLSQINNLTDTNNQAITENTEIALPKSVNLNNFKYKIKKDGTVIINNSILPDEYQQVEYIESTGKQYIDTGYIANSKTNVNISFSYIENNGDEYSNGMLFGSADNLYGRPSYSIGITKDEKIYYRNSDSAESFNSDTINKNQIYRVNTFENNIEIDDTEYNNEMNLLSNVQNYSSYLFARHHPDGYDPVARCIF